MMNVIDRPTASAAEKPKSRSAPRFHDVMMPSRSLLTIASSLDSTIAARRHWSLRAARTMWTSAEITVPTSCKRTTCSRSAGLPLQTRPADRDS
jgi:hypothetical protein